MNDMRIVVYPNPVTNGQFTIYDLQLTANRNPLSIEIYDLSGKCVYSAKPNSTSSIVNGTFTVNVSHLRAGTYILRYGTYTQKIVKK